MQADGQIEDLEKRLCTLLESVQGAGKVQVMITLENTGETIYAQDQKTQTQAQNSTVNTTNDTTHVVLDGGNADKALVETQYLPEIKGVAVVCTGGNDIIVVKRITDLVSVVLGISSNRVCVTN